MTKDSGPEHGAKGIVEDVKGKAKEVIGKVSDVLFIRRALSDSLARTLRRFSVEAAEEVAL